MKLIHRHLYDPSLPSWFFGKPSKTERAKLHEIFCDKTESCGLFARGECIHRNMFTRCQFGNHRVTSSPGRRSAAYCKWMSESRSLDMPTMKAPAERMARIGDHVYMPYPHTDLKTVVPMSEITAETIQSLANHRPRALFGGEIQRYQKEVVPKMLSHLREELPELFEEWASKYPDTAAAKLPKSNVGRKAFLDTLLPGVVLVKRGTWVWDGEFLVVENPEMLLPPIDVESGRAEFRPKKGVVVTVLRDDQVGPNTKFQE